MTEVRRSADCANSPKNAKAEGLALALMGVGELPGHLLAEAASWDRPGGAVTGRAAILATLSAEARAPAADLIRVEQVVTHGKAGSVSGRVTRGAETRLFCHVLRFSSAAATQVVQLVSFEHRVG